MDFFAMQDEARRRTRRLVVLFVLAVLGIAAGIYGVLVFADLMLGTQQVQTGATHGTGGSITTAELPAWWSPTRFLLTLAIVGVIVGGGSLFKLAQYRAGGGAVARSLGAREVDRLSARGDERRLVNIVEEMALASGVPVPGIYILENEPGINAFAAGYAPGDAAVAVTRGCLDTLDRDELQGVIAHEFSHILNGDMRLNLRLAGVVFGILVLSIVGRGLLRSLYWTGGARRSRRSGDGKGMIVVVLLAIALIILGLIGQFFGRLIQAAISRQREFLADASAVQFTRNPDGIAGALRRIGASSARGVVGHAGASGLAHLFFADPLHKGFSAAFATHPPLQERIRRIDPAWDGKFHDRPARHETKEPSREGEDAAGVRSAPITAAILMASIGTLSADAVQRSRGALAQLPREVRDALGTPEGCLAALLVLFADEDPAVREKQTTIIAQRMSADVLERFRMLLPRIHNLDTLDPIAIAELAVAGLRKAPADERAVLVETMELLVKVDRAHTLREFCLLAIVHSRLGDAPAGAGASPVADPEAALLGALREPPKDYAALQGALAALRAGDYARRRAFLEAAVTEIVRDGEVTPAERKIIRALAIAMDCPLPIG